METPNQLLQICGALLILVAYVLLQMGLMKARSISFGLLNLVGASLLAWEAWRTWQLGFLILEGTWALVSAFTLIKFRGREIAP